jgi:Flp pilus assembly CpaF family ATPase
LTTPAHSWSLVAERSFGLGPSAALLRDPSVDHVVVNGPDQVWVEREGRIEPTAARCRGEADLRHTIERILEPLGRRVDEAEPLSTGARPRAEPSQSGHAFRASAADAQVGCRASRRCRRDVAVLIPRT